jgi:C-terminal associated domain of TOPRIM
LSFAWRAGLRWLPRRSCARPNTFFSVERALLSRVAKGATVPCAAGDADGDAIEMAFSKRRVDERKVWLGQYKPGTFLDQSQDRIAYEDFIHKVRRPGAVRRCCGIRCLWFGRRATLGCRCYLLPIAIGFRV